MRPENTPLPTPEPAPQPPVALEVSREPVDYEAAVASMESKVREIREKTGPETLWLLEHPALYTAGTSASEAEILDPRFPVHHTGRGGRVTYHGPGQRIGYVMMDLTQRGSDVRGFVRDLESWLIAAIGRFGVTAERREGRVGLWVARKNGTEEKIAALGVRVRRWVTFHGVALNVAPDLGHYAGIVPCGISEHGVTSLADLGVKAEMAEVDRALRETFEDTFGRRLASAEGRIIQTAED